MRALARHWFLLGLGAALAAAWAAPDLARSGGTLALDRARPWLIAAIFLVSGATLPTRALADAVTRWRAHAFVQAFSLLLVPALLLALDPLLAAAGLPPALRRGMLVLAAVPTTIASCVAFTRASGGDEALALCNAVLGNLLGLVVAPAVLLFAIGRAAEVPALPAVRALAVMVALPFAIGQLARWRASAACDRLRPPAGQLTHALLLVILWQVFADAVDHRAGVGPGGLAAVAALALALHGLLLAAAFGASAWPALRLDRAGRAAATICAVQKTVALGVPLVAVLFAGDPALPLYALPLLLYHALQLVVAGLAAQAWRTWIARDPAPATPR